MNYPRNCKRIKRAVNNHTYRIAWLKYFYPPYDDDGVKYYGNKMSYQCRMYRTWKHYRNKQYKQ